MQEINNTIAKRLKKTMNKKGLGKSELSALSEVPLDIISAALDNKGLSMEYAVLLTKALHISLNSLVGRRTNKKILSDESEAIKKQLNKLKNGQTYKEIEKETHISTSTLSDAFSEGKLTIDTAKQLAKFFHTNLDYIYGNDCDYVNQEERLQEYIIDIINKHLYIDNSNADNPELYISKPLDTYLKDIWRILQENDYPDETYPEPLKKKKADNFLKALKTSETDTLIDYIADKKKCEKYDSF